MYLKINLSSDIILLICKYILSRVAEMQDKEQIKFLNCTTCKKLILDKNFGIHIINCEKRLAQRSKVNQKQDLEAKICPYCKKQILNDEFTDNMAIHLQKCHPHQSKIQISKKNGSQSKSIYKDVSELKKKQQIIELIPCSFCGYQQTLEELDTHPQSCAHRTQQCTYCSIELPLSLMEQHVSQVHHHLEQPQIRNHHIPPPHNYNSPNYRMRHNHYHHHHHMEDDEEDGQIDCQNCGQCIPVRQYQRHIRRCERMNDMNLGMPGVINLIRRRSGPDVRSDPERMRRHMFSALHMFHHPSSRNRNQSNLIQMIRMLAMREFNNQGSEGHQEGLSPNELKLLKKISYKPKQEKQLCTICYCQFDENQNITELGCKHLYHPQCINQWLSKNSKCPVCKRCVRQQKKQKPHHHHHHQYQFQEQEFD